MAEATAFYTAAMVRDLIEEDRPSPRYETVYGELLVTPAPRPTHQYVLFQLSRRIADYLDREPVGQVWLSPADVSWGRTDVLVQPDLFVIPQPDAPVRIWSQVAHLLLAVEALSPGSERADRFTKRRLYQAQGVPTYWMLDIDDAAVHVWMPDAQLPAVERERLAWHPEGAGEPFTLPLADLFRGL